ncbi:hypothetical protein MHBO_001714 [Bonamia ostreae]|uniref:ABC transporter domain-containing protein n=1 Tax=Bonamia ostreae TaxID=126728 RepID=A0ABV2AJX2_9EUKA
MGFYQPLKGKVEINENAKISFFTQHHVDSLDLEKSALENITKQFEDEIPEQIDNKAEYCRKRLGRFGISQDLATRPLRHLSGGQKSRVAFCALVWNSPHLLVLDEPTNHLDMETIDALIDAVNKYEGGLLIVSHDQYFLSKVAKTFWALDNGKLQNFSSLSAIKKYVLGK